MVTLDPAGLAQSRSRQISGVIHYVSPRSGMTQERVRVDVR